MRTVEYSVCEAAQCVCVENSAVAVVGCTSGKLGQWRRLGGASTCPSKFQELQFPHSPHYITGALVVLWGSD